MRVNITSYVRQIISDLIDIGCTVEDFEYLLFDLEALKSATVEFDESSIVALNQTYGSETLTLDINPLQVRAERPELLPQAPASGAYLPVMFGQG